MFISVGNNVYGISPNETSDVYSYTGTSNQWIRIGTSAENLMAFGSNLYMIQKDTGNILRYQLKNAYENEDGLRGRVATIKLPKHRKLCYCKLYR